MKILNSDYWQNQLETDYPDAVSILENIGKVDYVLQGFLNGRMFRILCEHFNLSDHSLEGSTISTKALNLFKNHQNELLQIILLCKFRRNKRSVAIEKVAKSYLDDKIIKSCSMDKNKYDYDFLLLSLFLEESEYLQEVMLWDLEDRKGHASFILNKTLDNNGFFNWCSKEKLRQILKDFGSLKSIDVRSIYIENDRLYIFIVRDAQRDSVKIEESVQFGNKLEWIVLNFNKTPNELFISAKRIPEAVKIANAIIQSFANDDELEYEDAKILTPSDKIDELCSSLINQNLICEIKIENAPLEGEPTILLTNEYSISASLIDLTNRLDYDPLEDKRKIRDLKIFFKEHRVTLKFDWIQNDNCIVRYTDSKLKGIEKDEFVNFMKENFNVEVISTEKRANR